MTGRHARQIKLVEVGEAGQERIARKVCSASGTGLASIVEARYLAGAGVERLVVEADDVARAARDVDVSVRVEVTARPARRLDAPKKAPASDVESALLKLAPGAREVALGAYRALVAIREAIGILPP